MKIYFYGFQEPFIFDCYLYGETPGVRYGVMPGELSFPVKVLGGALLPEGYLEQGKAVITQINGWTIISLRDRSLNTRQDSTAEFFVDTLCTKAELIELAQNRFSSLCNRIGGEMACK